MSNIAETQEADSVKFSQLVFNSKNNTVNRRLYQPGEIMKERGNKMSEAKFTKGEWNVQFGDMIFRRTALITNRLQQYAMRIIPINI